MDFYQDIQGLKEVQLSVISSRSSLAPFETKSKL